MKAIMNWSGGKDSTLALYKVLSEGIELHGLFTTISHQLRRITMHGVREELLDAQAAALGILLQKLELPASDTMDLYNELMQEKMNAFKMEGVTHSVFGDIHLEDLKKYREEQLKKVGVEALFPLWKRPVSDVVTEFINLGFKAVVVCVNARYLDQSFVGRILDADFIKDLPDNVDVCGENGEFHSFVYDGPIFKQPVPIALGEVVYKDYSNGTEDLGYDTGFHFQDLILSKRNFKVD
jgi:uncharacterized protein (TIGR00290 family)